jgi:hypothetical protein
MTHPLSCDQPERTSVRACDLYELKLNQIVELTLAGGKKLLVSVLHLAEQFFVGRRDGTDARVGPIKICDAEDDIVCVMMNKSIFRNASRTINAGKPWQYGDEDQTHHVHEITVLTDLSRQG